jgi:ribosomal protein S25
VFGNRYLAEVVTAIADETTSNRPRVTVRMIASRVQLTDSLVRLVTQRLVKAELLNRLEQDRARAPAYHEVQRSSGIWDALVDMCARLASESTSGP